MYCVGDIVLADQGFTCQDHIGMYMAEIKMPPFTQCKKQLEKYAVDRSRELSLVRIHVDRVIGNLKQKYTVLLPVHFCNGSNELTIIDKIVLYAVHSLIYVLLSYLKVNVN